MGEVTCRKLTGIELLLMPITKLVKKCRKKVKTVRIRLILSANPMLLVACWLIYPAQCKEVRLMN